jgi:tRNA pseudouridine55 synthase
MRPPANPTSGILLVDKPPSLTSHDVVARARRIVGTRKVGHAGTLDPMATGLLVLGVNSSTRLLTYLVGLDKMYTATIRLGAASSTDDADGDLGERASASAIAAVTDASIAAGVAALTGAIRQRPSSVSAIKVDGERAYSLARQGAEVVLAERSVTISTFDVLALRRGDFIDVDVRVECSSGTYIRALARDLGADLAIGGHLTRLRRERVGPFAVTEASALDDTLTDHLIPPADAAIRLFPPVALTAPEAEDLGNGKRISLGDVAAGPLAAIDPDGRLVGIVESQGGRARVLANFPRDEVRA